MQISRWEPSDSVDRYFAEHPLRVQKLGWDFAIDLYEQGGDIIAKMNLPGVDPADLEVTVDEDSLTISGTRSEEEEVDDKEYFSKEIRRGAFSRVIDLPSLVDPVEAVAEYENGILKVVIPRIDGQRRQGVPVTVIKK